MMKRNTILAAIIFLLKWTVNAQYETMYVMKNGIITCQISVNQADLQDCTHRVCITLQEKANEGDPDPLFIIRAALVSH